MSYPIVESFKRKRTKIIMKGMFDLPRFFSENTNHINCRRTLQKIERENEIVHTMNIRNIYIKIVMMRCTYAYEVDVSFEQIQCKKREIYST